MRRRPGYSIIFFGLIVFVGITLTIYWTIAADFPNISVWGWAVVAAYMVIAFVVPTVLAPFVSRTVNMSNYIAWRVVMAVWVSSTAIAGLLAWPIIGSYIKPLFVGGAHAL